MAKFDINKHSDLQKLRDTLNTILEERMRKAGLKEILESLSDQPFGAIKNVFEGISDKLYESPEGKKIIGKYVKAIREGKNSSDAYSVYEFVYHSPVVENPERFLNEAVSLMTEDFDRKAFANDKKRIANVVAEAVSLVGEDADFVRNEINRNLDINEAIDYIITNKKSFGNLAEYVNKVSIVEKHLAENMQEMPNEYSSKTGKELMSDLNEALEGLSDWEKDAIKEVTLTKLSKSNLSELFEAKKNECLEKIDEAIENENSIETKAHLENMRKQLSEKKYNEETIVEDIVTLAELNKTLNE